MAYTLYNNNKYATRDGVVTSGTTFNSDVDGGALKMMGTALSAGLRAVALNVGDNESPVLQPRDGVQPAHLASALTASSITSGNGVQRLLRINFPTGTPHALSVGSVVAITDTAGVVDGGARVYSIPNSTGIIVNRPYAASTGTITVAASSGNMSNMLASNYSIRGVYGTVHSLAISKLLSPASDYGRSKVHKVNAVRTSKVATAVRAGYWNMFTGSWTTAPSTSNDYANFDLDGSNVPDDETKSLGTNREVGGEFAYSQQRTVVSGNYEAKTG